MELSWFILTLLLTVYKSNGEIRQEPEIFANRSSTVTLTCEHDNSDHYSLFWYKQAKGTVDLSLMVFSASQNQGIRVKTYARALAFAVLGKFVSAHVCCDTGGGQAYFGNGTKLTVLDPDVTITEPTLKILNTTRCKEKVTLVCVAENFYPDHVSIKWTLGDKEITEDVATDPYATKDENTKMFNISSRLKVSKKEFTPKNTFRCTVTFNNSTHVSEKTVYITGTGGISLDIS
uniref:Ig-like domain-containing protein n=1 Tax=Cyprinus carpio TaxID=7962 RepID=A0A8C1KRC5_CYPCA